MTSLTHLDFSFFCPVAGQSGSLIYPVALNPLSVPGALVVACGISYQQGVGGQLAGKLATQHFCESAQRNRDDIVQSDRAQMIVEQGFFAANSAVYAFGHKLAAGGRMAASLTALVIDCDCAAAGRAGEGAVYVERAGMISSFFAGLVPTGPVAREQLVGAHSQVPVEIASIPLHAGDKLWLTSRELTEAEQALLPKGFSPELCQLNCYIASARLGKEAIFLR